MDQVSFARCRCIFLVCVNVILKCNINVALYYYKMSIHECISAYPIVDGILSNLSATDSSAFLCAMKIELPDTTKNKYLKPVRDLPEHEEWIDSMVKAGNQVLLAGSDLLRLHTRILHPDTYNRKNERPLCIWLICIPMDIIRYNNRSANGMQNYVMTWDGDFKTVHDVLKTYDIENVFNTPERGCPSSMFICRFDHMVSLPSSDRGSGWYVSTIHNQNNINIVYYASYSSRCSGLNACVQQCTEDNLESMLCHRVLKGTCDINLYEDEIWNVPLLRYRSMLWCTVDDNVFKQSFAHLNIELNKMCVELDCGIQQSLHDDIYSVSFYHMSLD